MLIWVSSLLFFYGFSLILRLALILLPQLHVFGSWSIVHKHHRIEVFHGKLCWMCVGAIGSSTLASVTALNLWMNVKTLISKFTIREIFALRINKKYNFARVPVLALFVLCTHRPVSTTGFLVLKESTIFSVSGCGSASMLSFLRILLLIWFKLISWEPSTFTGTGLISFSSSSSFLFWYFFFGFLSRSKMFVGFCSLVLRLPATSGSFCSFNSFFSMLVINNTLRFWAGFLFCFISFINFF